MMSGMGGLFGLVLLVASIWFSVIILKKAGFSPWWSLILLIPIVNIVALWYFAFGQWPKKA